MSLNTILATAPLTTSGYHIKANGTTLGNSLIWDNGTNVGIGNTNTSYTLDVSGTGRFTGALTVGGTVTAVGLSKFWDGTQGLNIGAFSAGAGYGAIYSTGVTPSSTNFSVASNGLSTYVNATNDAGIVINNGSKGIFLVSSGNVGIGTSTPTAITGFTSVCVNNATTGGFFEAQQGGTVLSRYGAQNDISFIDTVANIPFIIKTNSTERMRITSGGNVGIGTTAPSYRLQVNSPSGDWGLHVKGVTTASNSYGLFIDAGTNSADSAFLIRNADATVNYFRIRGDGAFYTGSGSNSPMNATTGNGANVYIDNTDTGRLYRSTSSIKYKKDVIDYTRGLNEVMQLRPVFYKGISDNDGDKQFAGLIAEEVDELGLTEFVQYRTDGTPDALAYQNMVALAFKAIQEQNQLITSLQDRLDKAGL